jgi:hypothetical protein
MVRQEDNDMASRWIRVAVLGLAGLTLVASSGRTEQTARSPQRRDLESRLARVENAVTEGTSAALADDGNVQLNLHAAQAHAETARRLLAKDNRAAAQVMTELAERLLARAQRSGVRQ